MTFKLFIFLAVSNLLIATIVAFVFTFLLVKSPPGGFWAALTIALIGAFFGTLMGIFLEGKRLIENILIIRYLVPVLFSALLLFFFLSISSWHNDE